MNKKKLEEQGVNIRYERIYSILETLNDRIINLETDYKKLRDVERREYALQQRETRIANQLEIITNIFKDNNSLEYFSKKIQELETVKNTIQDEISRLDYKIQDEISRLDYKIRDEIDKKFQPYSEPSKILESMLIVAKEQLGEDKLNDSTLPQLLQLISYQMYNGKNKRD